jgi:hypothetical protein
MLCAILNRSNYHQVCLAKAIAVAALLLCSVRHGRAQDTPLISGGGGFTTNTNGGKTTYSPLIEPVAAIPLGSHVLVESRAALEESWAPNGNNQPGYDHSHFVSLTYLQGDWIVSPHLTVVGGTFLLPFETYTERLSPLWIGNFQSAPLSYALGNMSTSVGTGGMVRGSAFSRRKLSIDYTAYFSSRVGNQYFAAERSSGGRTNFYLPDKRLEIGFSYNRSLQGFPASHENFYGTHVWWEPVHTAFRFRSEFARGHHAQGYWVEFDYRTQVFHGLDSWIGRIEPVFRMNQTFRRDTVVSDGLPLVNTQRADFGLDYNLPHNTRILTSYSRQFASTGNHNIWQTGIVYRFLFPTWKGK